MSKKTKRYVLWGGGLAAAWWLLGRPTPTR